MRMMSHTPSRSRPFIKTFGDAIRKVRSKRQLTAREIAAKVGASINDVYAWETGEAIPRRHHLRRLYDIFPALKYFTELLPEQPRFQLIEDTRAHDLSKIIAGANEPIPAEFLDEELPPPPPRPTPVVEAKPPPPTSKLQKPPTPQYKTFGEALRAARTEQKLSLTEVGELLDVTGGSVRSWETNLKNPVIGHYMKLLELFPALRTNCPRPDIKDWDKPDSSWSYLQNRVSQEGEIVVEVRQIAPEDRQLPPIAESSVQQTNDLDQAAITYAHALKDACEDELRLSTLRSALADAEHRLEESKQRVQAAHEHLIDLSTRR